MEKGKIIFLNGVSSTGKSTLSKTLLQRLNEPYHWLNVDNFMTFTDMSKHPAVYFEEGKDPVSLFPHVVKLYLAEETIEKCADRIIEFVESDREGIAFNKLRSMQVDGSNA